MKILMINGSPHPRGGDVPGQQLRPDAGLARLRHVAGTQWGYKKYMNMKHLEAALDDASIAGYFIQPEPANNFAHKS